MLSLSCYLVSYVDIASQLFCFSLSPVMSTSSLPVSMLLVLLKAFFMLMDISYAHSHTHSTGCAVLHAAEDGDQFMERGGCGRYHAYCHANHEVDKYEPHVFIMLHYVMLCYDLFAKRLWNNAQPTCQCL